MDKELIAGYECKHAILCPAVTEGGSDLTLIKEIIHLKDGNKEIHLRHIKDYKRDFYLTRKEYRNHSDKKEYEDINKLQKFSSTESNLCNAIARAAGSPGLKTSLRRLARSPYLYGADITSTAIIKKEYLTRYPDFISPNTVAALDIETDTVEGHGLPIIVGLTFGDLRIVSIDKAYIGTIQSADEKLRKLFTKYLGEYENENTQLIIDIADNPADAIEAVIRQAHIWKPDFISIWNIEFDLPQMIKCLDHYKRDLKDVFSDPSIPKQMRFADYIQGPKQKKKSNGDITPIHWTEQWHTMSCPASFYFIDSACVYRRIRIAEGMEQSYKLDDILHKNLGLRKLKFDDILEEAAPHIRSGTLAWHQYMQKNFKLEYVIYNLFDCISLEELDKTTQDLALTLSILCEHSDYRNFSSQPRRIADDLHFFVQQYDRIMATTSDQMSDENDSHIVSLSNWIVTLPSHLVDNNGLKVLEELPDVPSMIRSHVYDLDVAGTYPNVECIFNISKETTYRELSEIRDVSDDVRRRVGINLTSGIVNAVEICNNIYNLPSFDEFLREFESQEMV